MYQRKCISKLSEVVLSLGCTRKVLEIIIDDLFYGMMAHGSYE